MNHYFIPSLLPKEELISLPKNLQEQIENLRKMYFKSTDEALAKEVFSQLKDLNIDTYIIACTELAVAYTETKLELPAINLAELQCWYMMKIKKTKKK